MSETQKKVCSTCREPKSVTEFHRYSKSPDGLNPQCKECRSKHGKEWYASNVQIQNDRVRASIAKKIRNNAILGVPHQCNLCGFFEPEVSFELRRVDGKMYKRHACRECIRKYKKQYSTANCPSNSPEEKRKRSARDAAIESYKRGIKQYTSLFVFQSSNSADKKLKRENNLTLDFVKELLGPHECMYCGDTEVKVTLDRIDNTLGHLKTNVNPACVRCNGIRGNMPYEAWMELVPKIREIREKGMLDGWIGRSFAKKVVDDPRIEGYAPIVEFSVPVAQSVRAPCS